MANDAQRTRIGGYVSEEAYDGWAQFATHQGVTITALIEAVGHLLARFDVDADIMESHDFRDVVSEAREVVARRNSRRLRRPPDV